MKREIHVNTVRTVFQTKLNVNWDSLFFYLSCLYGAHKKKKHFSKT